MKKVSKGNKKQKVVEKQLDNLRILGRDYKITYVPPSALSVNELGTCNNFSQEICLSLNQSPIEATDTFIHEVFHALDYIVGLDLTEHQVRHLASTFIGVIQDNPEWASWVIQDKTLERELGESERTTQ